MHAFDKLSSQYGLTKFRRFRVKDICSARVQTSVHDLEVIKLPKQRTRTRTQGFEADVVATNMKRRRIEATETTSTIVNE